MSLLWSLLWLHVQIPCAKSPYWDIYLTGSEYMCKSITIRNQSQSTALQNAHSIPRTCPVILGTYQLDKARSAHLRQVVYVRVNGTSTGTSILYYSKRKASWLVAPDSSGKLHDAAAVAGLKVDSCVLPVSNMAGEPWSTRDTKKKDWTYTVAIKSVCSDKFQPTPAPTPLPKAAKRAADR
jgi:hypothetical protein